MLKTNLIGFFKYFRLYPSTLYTNMYKYILSQKNLWALLLYMPVVFFYGAYFFSPLITDGTTPTGFINYDMFYYMANAREYYDATDFHLFYQSTYSDSYNNSYIYFQPHTFLLGMLMKIFGDSPGIIYCCFGAVAGFACLRIVVGFFTRWIGLETIEKKIALLLLCWGGGLLSIAGFIFQLYKGENIETAYQLASVFDPFDGWWFLNLGRNLIYPTEAYYHAVFFGSVWALYEKRYRLFIGLVFLLSISHPFSGTELLLIALTYFFLEKFFILNTEYPSYLFWSLIIISIIHFGYYGLYLMSDHEHYTLVKQWALDWLLGGIPMIFAYCLSGSLFLAKIHTLDKAKEFFSNPFHRFLLIWFIVAFLLANHEFAIDPPIQPLHFTKGYIWTPLFLMGLPVLLSILSFLKENKVYRFTLLPLLILIFLSDNLMWMPLNAKNISQDEYLYKTPEIASLFQELKKEKYKDHLIITNDYKVGYWATVYTPLRSWYSHGYNTPNRDDRPKDIEAFFSEGKINDEWKGREIVIILNKKTDAKHHITRLNIDYEKDDYVIMHTYVY